MDGYQETHYPSMAPQPQPPQDPFSIDLLISKRLLWIGGAVYPIHNVIRVHTFWLQPRRKEAVMRFLKRFMLLWALCLGVLILSGLTSLATLNPDSTLEKIADILMEVFGYGSLVALAYIFMEMVTVLLSRPRYALGIDMSGPSTAVVTGHPEALNQLVGRIAYAIENPETEFWTKVSTLSLNMKNYYFGDNVHMYGGTNNIGIAS